MLMIVMSLAISLAAVPGLHSLAQQKAISKEITRAQPAQQENRNTTPPDVLPKAPGISVNPLALPPGDNAWTVQIVSSGGFTGSERTDLTLTSDGLLTWSGADGACSRRLTDKLLHSLAEAVLAANVPTTGSETSLSMMCFDCYVTTMLLQRGIGGVVSAVTVSWDDVSQAKIAADMVSIYKAVKPHKGCSL